MKKRMHKPILTAIVCPTAFCLLLSATLAVAGPFGQLIHEKNSLYHRIFVYKQGPIVTLQFGKRTTVPIQSQVNLNNLRQHTLDYTKLTFCGLLYKPEPKKMLLLGLGGGVIPREMHYYFPQLDIDVAEIDPDVSRIATQFFAFQQDEKLKVHIDDGRMFIKKQLRQDPIPKYDLIVLDAFNSDYIPFHLMTKEFLEEVKGVLADDGVVVANVFHSNRLFDAELKTFLDVFGRCQAFMGTHSTNAMLVACGPTAQTLTVNQALAQAETLQQKHRFAFNLLMVARQLHPNITPDRRAKVLTDDRAPVNWLRTQERE